LSMCFSRLRSAFGSFDMGKIRKYAAAMAVVVVALGHLFLLPPKLPRGHRQNTCLGLAIS
jgi:hypothetical protein